MSEQLLGQWSVKSFETWDRNECVFLRPPGLRGLDVEVLAADGQDVFCGWTAVPAADGALHVVFDPPEAGWVFPIQVRVIGITDAGGHFTAPAASAQYRELIARMGPLAEELVRSLQQALAQAGLILTPLTEAMNAAAALGGQSVADIDRALSQTAAQPTESWTTAFVGSRLKSAVAPLGPACPGCAQPYRVTRIGRSCLHSEGCEYGKAADHG